MGEHPPDREYRRNVGVCLINPFGLVWMGRTQTAGPEIVTPGNEWQMPQGGIDPGESMLETARRDLAEETGVVTVRLLARTDVWWDYDFPPDYVPTGHKLDPFVGQRQKWVAFGFLGDDSEVDISAQNTAEPQEFTDWKWMHPEEGLRSAVLFKQEQYRRVFGAFSHLLYPN